MEEDGRYMTEKILDLTLEIISLLTGETFTAVKSGDLVAIMVPPFHFMMPEITDQQRLLELTNKMVELLTGESGIFGHCVVTDKKDLTDRSLGTKQSGHSGAHKVAMTKEEPTDESRIPPERSPHPLYSQDATQEAQEIPHHDQVGDVVVVKVLDTDDEEDTCMEEEQPPLKSLARTRNPQEMSSSYLYSRDSLQEAQEIPHHHQVSIPERCPHPLYSQDITQDVQELPHHIQSEDLIVVKVGVKEEEEEPYAAGGQQSTEEVEIRLNVKVGEISANVNPAQEHITQKTSAVRLASPPHYILEDDDAEESLAGEHLTDLHPKASCPLRHRARGEWKDKFSCPDCGKCLTSKYNLMIHQRVHTGERPFSCLECGRSFTRKENLQHHQKLHAGQKAFPCYKCGKCFVKPSGLIRHLKTHTVNRHKVKNASKRGLSFPHNHEVHNVQNFSGEVPAPPNIAETSPKRAPTAGQAAEKGQFSCPVCGKCFGSNFNLQVHKRVHTGERPFSCLDCGRTFTRKENLKRHQVTHSEHGRDFRRSSEDGLALPLTQEVEGDVIRKFVCSECGKCFKAKSSLRMHWRHHIGDLPFSCSECGKRFAQKSALDKHSWLHTGERPFLCSECGKAFTRKSDLIMHVRIHTSERPYSCSECGKGFIRNTELQKHLRVHTGERPFHCSDCDRRFNWKADLVKHQKFHSLSEGNDL